MVDIDFHRFVTGNEHIDAQIKLVTVNQQWVGNVFADYTSFINIDIVDVIDQVDASSLARVCRFHDPNILLAFVLLEFLVVIVKVTKLIGKNVGIWREIKCTFAEALLHSDDVEAESIFACDLVRLREVIDFLVLIQAFVLV